MNEDKLGVLLSAVRARGLEIKHLINMSFPEFTARGVPWPVSWRVIVVDAKGVSGWGTSEDLVKSFEMAVASQIENAQIYSELASRGPRAIRAPSGGGALEANPEDLGL